MGVSALSTAAARRVVLGLVLTITLTACGSTDRPTAAPSTSPTIANCRQSPDWPTTTSPVGGVAADVNGDGAADQVAVFEDGSGNGRTVWVRVEFDNGGVATGRWTGERVGTEPISGIHVTELSASDQPAENKEIIIQVDQVDSVAEWGVLAIDGCDLVTTTLDGESFGFVVGRRDRISTIAGCKYLAGDRIDFIVTTSDLSIAEWDVEAFELRGVEWTLIEALHFADFPTGDGSIYYPTGPTLDRCRPLS